MIGFDKFPLNVGSFAVGGEGLVLALPLEEMSGVAAFDRSKFLIHCTLHGVPTWNSWIHNDIPYLDFDPTNPDWLDAPAGHTELDFTSEMFSMALWINVDDLAADRYLLVRGVASTDGWFFFVQSTGRLGFATNQAAAIQATYSGAADVVVGTWYLVGATRTGASVRLYLNGHDVTDAADTHINPLTAARELHIGIQDDEASNPWDGQLAYPRIWSMRVLTPQEMLDMFEYQRHWFGV